MVDSYADSHLNIERCYHTVYIRESFDILPLKIVTLQSCINRAVQTEKTLLFSTSFQVRAVEQYWAVYSFAYYDVRGGSFFF